LVLDWTQPLRHATFYKAIYRPAVLRANRLTPTAKLHPDLSFHSLRHTYASLCVAAGIKPIDIAELMGHRDVKTTLTVYAHLINTDDHAETMAALGALRVDTELRRQCCPAARLAPPPRSGRPTRAARRDWASIPAVVWLSAITSLGRTSTGSLGISRGWESTYPG
jgi:hypothetical protein